MRAHGKAFAPIRQQVSAIITNSMERARHKRWCESRSASTPTREWPTMTISSVARVMRLISHDKVAQRARSNP